MGWFDAWIEPLGWTHFWMVLGVVLAIVEVLTVGFFVLPFALGALVTALFAWMGLELTGQLLVFAATSLVMLFVIQMLVRKYLTSREGEGIKTNYEAMAGRKAVVLSPISGSLTRGRVKVGGEEWAAVTEDGRTFETGETVEVVAVDGAKLIVKGPGTDTAPKAE